MSNDSVNRRKKMAFSVLSGGTAALVTQPFEVFKTVSLCSIQDNQQSKKSRFPSLQTLKNINLRLQSIYAFENRGLRNFFRGAGVGFFRQALGFTLYSQILEELNLFFDHPSKENKWLLTASIAGVSKGIAITLSCPLVVLKTRLELALAPPEVNTRSTTTTTTHRLQNSMNLRSHIAMIVKEKGYFQGLSSLLSRELAFSIFHYTSFQFFKNHFDKNRMFQGNTFVAPYVSGIIGVLLSQPFEVIRSRMMIQATNLPAEYQYASLINAFAVIMRNDGIVGFFQGIVPRLIRKPINTGITWGIYELLKHSNQKSTY